MPSTVLSTGHLEMGKTKEALALKELTFSKRNNKKEKEGREEGKKEGREGGYVR